MDPMTHSRIATTPRSDRPARTLTERARGIALAVATLLATSTAVAVAAPANAAIGSITCPSTACVRVVAGVGDPHVAVSEKPGLVYVLYATSGELREINVATAAIRSIATDLGNNLRGFSVTNGNAYVTSWDGSLQQVDLATGSHRILAGGQLPLFAVTHSGTTTYVVDLDGRLLAVPDAGSPRVVSNYVGFSLSISLDNKGLAYTGDLMTGDILQTNLATGETRSLATQQYEPASVTVANDGQIYFMVGDQIRRMNPTTGLVTTITILSLNGINEFALASDGAAYAAGGDMWQINGLTAH